LAALDVRWSCAAQLDLLGFSNHLMVANWDIRSQTGGQAIERLSSLEDAIRLFERERTRYPDIYPDGLKYIRFNDALFIGVDVEHLFPPTGRTTLTGGYSMRQLWKLKKDKRRTMFAETAKSGSDVAKFLGLVARIHRYVNLREVNQNFPGCRTVVASGLRKCFKDRNDIDDFFSANFSISIAFEAEKKGRSVGLEGNNLYVEDDVAMAISYCRACYAILGFSKFFRTDSPATELYHHQSENKEMLHFQVNPWITHEPIKIDIMNKRLTLRRLNDSVLTNLQLFKEYQRIGAKAAENGSLEKSISESLIDSTPSLEDVNEKEKQLIKADTFYPFLNLVFSLGTDYTDFFGKNEKIIT